MHLANRFDLELRPEQGPPAYRTRGAALPFRSAARRLGFHLRELPCGTALCPYHAHLVNEELFLVLEGTPSIRLPSGEHVLEPRDLVALPPGPESAHQLLNRAAEPALVLALSTTHSRDAIEYPDSGKHALGVADLEGDSARAPYPSLLRGAASPRLGGRTIVRALLREGRAVEYFDGEATDALPPPTVAASRDPRIVNLDGDWEPHAVGPFRGRRRRLGRLAGARGLGASIYRVAPGERLWPYHFHHVNEELALVLAGEGVLRGAEAERPLRAGDVALFPPGPQGAHAVRGAGHGELEILFFSSMEEPEVVEYPDADRIYVLVGSPPGSPEGRAVDLVFRRSDARPWSEQA